MRFTQVLVRREGGCFRRLWRGDANDGEVCDWRGGQDGAVSVEPEDAPTVAFVSGPGEHGKGDGESWMSTARSMDCGLRRRSTSRGGGGGQG